MKDFTEQLSSLVAKEMADAKGDPERMGTAIERLACALGLTVALAARGDPQMIDTLMTGAEAYAHEEAVSKGRFARLMAAHGIRS